MSEQDNAPEQQSGEQEQVELGDLVAQGDAKGGQGGAYIENLEDLGFYARKLSKGTPDVDAIATGGAANDINA